MKLSWWKYVTVFLIFVFVPLGLMLPVPRLPILNETIRNLYYHVPLWFGMVILLLISMIYAIKYLKTNAIKCDIISMAFAQIGIFYGILGVMTGSIWAKFTWGSFWTNDPKLNAAAVGLLIYFAYLVLRSSFTDARQKARISAVYNIFSYMIFVPIIFVLPRLVDSLHPGNGGNPGFNSYDLDNGMRLIFYPSVIAWTLLGVWISQIIAKIEILEQKKHDK